MSRRALEAILGRVERLPELVLAELPTAEDQATPPR